MSTVVSSSRLSVPMPPPMPVPMRDLSNSRIRMAGMKRLRSSFTAPSRSAVPAVPEGYTAWNNFPTELWSQEALSQVDSLDAEADKRNPDLHDIFVSDDFYAYALYELIEERLRQFLSLLRTEPTSMKTWHSLEALTFFIATLDDSAIDCIDDCDRLCSFVRVFAAAWYTLARKRQFAQPISLLTARVIPNAANVMMTAAKILEFWCDTADIKELHEIREIPTMLAVMLRRDGWYVEPKASRILGEYGELPADVDERPRKRTKTSGSTSEQLSKLASMTHNQVIKELSLNERALDFEMECSKYLKQYAAADVPLFEVGNEWASGFDVTKWPAGVRAQLSLARELDLDDDAPDFIARDARQYQSVRNTPSPNHHG